MYKASRRYNVLVLLLVVAGAIILFLLIRNKLFKVQTQQQGLLIAQQSELMDSLKIRSLSNLMPQILARINEELKDNPRRILSEETISMIASLSYTLTPYAYVEGESLSTKKLSPERGQLLLMLGDLNIDSGSLHRIFQQSSFSGADLRNADLSSDDLSGVDLSEADLSSANLQGANLSMADLSYTNLWGAILSKANLNDADLTRTILSWANLNEADLKRADIRESDLTSVQMRKADLSESVMKWTNLTGAFLNEADLTGADMFRTNLAGAQLTGTIMSKANLSLANLFDTNVTGAHMIDADMTDATVIDKNWLIRLNEWQVEGAEELLRKYKLSPEESNGRAFYRLKKLEN